MATLSVSECILIYLSIWMRAGACALVSVRKKWDTWLGAYVLAKNAASGMLRKEVRMNQKEKWCDKYNLVQWSSNCKGMCATSYVNESKIQKKIKTAHRSVWMSKSIHCSVFFSSKWHTKAMLFWPSSRAMDARRSMPPAKKKNIREWVWEGQCVECVCECDWVWQSVSVSVGVWVSEGVREGKTESVSAPPAFPVEEYKNRSPGRSRDFTKHS